MLEDENLENLEPELASRMRSNSQEASSND
jgi:hypothetical protein